ncbi:hypothetical protein FOA52_005883 [Chlamydomonas sp. UWO 241]|nr:hypothetical protein FOA52_005883 [Chlamydomonas sp. UWO 241]
MIRPASVRVVDCGKMAETPEACDAMDECTWCAPTFGFKASCYSYEVAVILPEQLWACDTKEEPSPPAPAELPAELASVLKKKSCEKMKTPEMCDDRDDCTWCVTTFSANISSCLSKDVAKFLPETLVTCDADAEDNKKPDCLALKAEGDCTGTKGCSWCTATVGTKPVAHCFSQDVADRIPESMMKCSGVEAVVAVTDKDITKKPDCIALKAEGDCTGTEGCSWCTATVGTKPVAHCFSQDVAELIPESMMKCSRADSDASDDDVAEPGLGRKSSCDKLKNIDDCDDEDDCTWCAPALGAGADMGACYAEDAAKFLPPMLFKCGRDAEKAPDCVALKTDDDCLDVKHCSWCESAISPGLAHCLGEDAAALIPAAMMTCEAGRHHHHHDDNDVSDDASSDASSDDASDDDEVAELTAALQKKSSRKCKKIENMDDCADKDDCIWCAPALGAGADMGACYAEDAAKFLPPMLFKCGRDAEKAPDCVALKTDDDCLDVKHCSWCESAISPGLAHCLGEDAAALIPAAMMTCEAGRHHHHHDDNDVSDDASSDASSDDASDDDEVAELTAALQKKSSRKCKKIENMDDCADKDDCIWCAPALGAGADMGACYAEDAAKFLPPMLFKCGRDAEKAPDCVALKTDDDCLDVKHCSWCESAISPGLAHCLGEDAAALIPAAMMTCEAGRHHHHHDDNDVSDDASSDASSDDASDDDEVAELTAALQKKSSRKCKKIENMDDCADKDDCIWCAPALGAGADMGACYAEDAAKFLPPMLFKCGRDAEKAPDCVALKTDDECLDVKHCSWCESAISPGLAHCLGEDAAALIPAAMMTCEAGRHHHHHGDASDDDVAELALGKGPDCSGLKDGRDCEHTKGCTWCESKFGGKAACYTDDVAKFLPPMAFTCGKDDHKHHHKMQAAAADVAAALGAVIPEIGCMTSKSERECVHTDGCSWCESAFVSGMGNCFPADIAVHFLPSMMKCSGERRREAEPAVAAAEDACSPLSKGNCAQQEACIWCESAAVAAACYKRDDAAKLPPAVFKCADLRLVQ